MMSEASPEMNEYFKYLKDNSLELYSIASKAKKAGVDPKDFVEIKLAENLAERVIGLISAVAPQLEGSGAIERVLELEKQFAPLDWRVALQIAYEISVQKFCEFKDKHEAMEVGIRVGFAYVTLGVVSAPLEGFTSLEIKKRNDGGEYFCLNYAGPIRAAGGTGAAVSVLIGDYVRVKNGYKTYDPTEKEVKRCAAELEDYHEYVANLQYFPSKKESDYMMERLPVEIGGDASEKYDISSALLKDIPRIETNKLRSGYCLIHSSCIPLKAAKLWKQLKKWGSDFEMGHWNFIEDFLKVQETMKSKGVEKKEDTKLVPDYTYVKDLVGGRPVIGHPMRNGAFRLRYGRARNTGFSAQAIHPATMAVLNDFVAIGTQLKVERPGKAAGFSSCDSIDGPIVKLNNGDVIYLGTEDEARKVRKDIVEIIYAGDVLVDYGDFLDRNHKLVPAGFAEEIWILHFRNALKEKGISVKDLAQDLGVTINFLTDLDSNFLFKDVSFEVAYNVSKILDIPLHPKFTYYWNTSNFDLYKELVTALKEGEYKDGAFYLKNFKAKRSLELLGVPHTNGDVIKVSGEHANFMNFMKKFDFTFDDSKSPLENINLSLDVKIEDKLGTFIGSRMGRPEKAKMRKLTGSPHGLFPVGEQGGRMRSVQSALTAGYIEAPIQMFKSKSSGKNTPLRVDEPYAKVNDLIYYDREGNEIGNPDSFKEEDIRQYNFSRIDIKELVKYSKNLLGTGIIPDMIKGVRGTTNDNKVAEYFPKALLRAKHDISVNKDGTIRYDCSEMPLTHFTPREVGASVKRLKRIGYKKDINGEPLKSEDQVLELKVQDVVLPCAPDALEDPADVVLTRTANFIDEALVKIYGQKPYYNLKSREDLIGHLICGLAPHTSAGIVGRIVGFSKTQGFYAHPYVHAAMRRDCDGDEACFLLLLDGFLNFSKSYLPSSRGSTMDAPLVLTSKILPTEVDDNIFNFGSAWSYNLDFYKACKEYKMPWEVKVPVISTALGTKDQYENIGYTHPTTNMNDGVLISAYKLLPSMAEKVEKQMDLAVKLRAVDQTDVAKLTIDKHFIRDTKGNLRKFSLQQFRCVACNEKYRRPPLKGKCVTCGGKIIFTISQGSVIKYMEISLMLANKYNIDDYTKQVLMLTQKRIDQVFGKEKEKQLGLADF